MSGTLEPKTIEDWRRRIREIDLQIVALLNERSRGALAMGAASRQVA